MPRKPDDGTSTIDEFLNPASMLTPGLAGSVTMIITNALSLHFGFTPSWTGLIISFLCGTLVFVSSVGLAKKLVFYVLNSLIIFSVAAGTTGFAASATQRTGWDFGLSPAYAAAPQPAPEPAPGPAAESRQVAQAQPADSPAAPVEPPADMTTELPAATFESGPEGLSQAALEAQLEALNQQLISVEKALAEAEAQAELARTEAETARQEAAEASRRAEENPGLPADAVKNVAGQNNRFFKQWF